LQYKFDWDPRKAAINIRRHKIAFRQAATVGIGETGKIFTVVHTFEQLNQDEVSIRIISARKATDAEVAQYREVNQ